MSPSPSKAPSNFYTYGFIVTLCFSCALVLSVMASALRPPQLAAEKLDISKQKLIAANILHPSGYFLMKDSEGAFVPAKHAGKGKLEPGSTDDYAAAADVMTVYETRIKPVLVDESGNVTSFADAGTTEDEYIEKNSKLGFANLPLKLAYQVYPNPGAASRAKDNQPESFIIPVNGFGLWDRIYGFIALVPDGSEVVGISWYKHAETPGLGATIAEPIWQQQFSGKQIFQADAQGKTNFMTSPIGIEVRRGKVVDELGTSPKSKSAVDGMAGATLTGVGVTKAYKDSLEPYRPFLIQLNKGWGKKKLM